VLDLSSSVTQSSTMATKKGASAMSRPSIFNTYGTRDVVAIARDHLNREYHEAIARGEIPYANIVRENQKAFGSIPSTG